MLLCIDNPNMFMFWLQTHRFRMSVIMERGFIEYYLLGRQLHRVLGIFPEQSAAYPMQKSQVLTWDLIKLTPIKLSD